MATNQLRYIQNRDVRLARNKANYNKNKGSYTCEYCDKGLSSNASRKRHQKTCKLRPDAPKPIGYACWWCHKVFATKVGADTHMTRACRKKPAKNTYFFAGRPSA